MQATRRGRIAPISPESVSESPRGPKPLKRKTKIGNGNACTFCRSRKVKCDGARPACAYCARRQRICQYAPVTVTAALAATPTTSHVSDPVGCSLTDCPSEASTAVRLAQSGSPSAFAGEVRAAIDARLGLPPAAEPILEPMVDAPLFQLTLDTHGCDRDNDIVLPPRKEADRLVDIYWRYVQPIDFFLARERFKPSYEALFAGTSSYSDECIFLSTLNLVFAYATQTQENMPHEKRDTVANRYFHRAWNLIRPGSVLWESGTPEMVQCLLLMGRYLQCTQNKYQAWMAVGSAIRIARNLGLHLVDSPVPGSADAPWHQHIWNCCLVAELTMSWVLGRTTVSLSTICASTTAVTDDYITKTMELHEISRHIIATQTHTSGDAITTRLGLPKFCYSKPSYCAAVVEFESCLDRWESTRLAQLASTKPNYTIAQNLSIHLRLLHARLILFRPMVARRFVSFQGLQTTGHAYKDSMIQHGSSICVAHAQKMIKLLHENANIQEPSALPWWYRIFYIHMAGTVLLAARLADDLFTKEVSHSWDRVIQMLQGHEHLSPFIRQILTSFQALAEEIPQKSPDYSLPLDTLSQVYFQDVFQSMPFDVDSFFFGDDYSLPAR